MSARRTDAVHGPGANAPGAGFAVVGVGASAGGLAAIEEFLRAVSESVQSTMAIVLVQHLDPDHESLLLELTRRCTTMDVQWAENGAAVRPGRVYIMPRDATIAISRGVLKIAKPTETHGMRRPINGFLTSLAEDQRNRAVGIILSGTGHDGTDGMRAIRQRGGLTLSQDPDSAAYDGMPRSAIDAGTVDSQLQPRDMPVAVSAFVRSGFVRRPTISDERGSGHEDGLREVLAALRKRSGHDFSMYKTNTIRRRIERRMAICRIDRPADYVALLQHSPAELDILFSEMLIGVTEFFRDPTAYETLADKAIPRLLASRETGGAIRVWVPGCSTGEEAYSLAIVLHETVAQERPDVAIQIFATDIDAEAVAKARAGVYAENIAANVSPKRLERYFVAERGSYRVSKVIRDMLVFAKQDIIKDPPFSRVDLISCRNMLIYFDSELQKRLMPMFHYALNEGGFLLLGSAESIGDSIDLFAPVDSKDKLFERKDAGTSRHRLSAASGTPTPRPERRAFEAPHIPEQGRLQGLAEQALLERHVPASVVINAANEIVYVHGHTGRYLEPARGEASGSLLKMARKGLARKLSSGIRTVRATGEVVRYERLHVVSEDRSSLINLVIEPLVEPDAGERLIMVLFEPLPVSPELDSVAIESPGDREQRIADLDRELSAKEDYLRTTVQELETSNEQLKSTNEELQSSNEELQSTNEELETSKEELQSVNEELVTVNSELQQKNADLSQVNNDMNNLLAGTGIGTVFLDNDLRIQRFTPAATQIIKLIESDVGRPAGDIASRLKGDNDLMAAAQSVLDTLAGKETEVETDDGRTFLMRIQPYRTVENAIEGAVMTFVDITAQRAMRYELAEAARLAEESKLLAESIVDTVRDPLLVLDQDLVVVSAGRSFLSVFGLAADAVIGHTLAEIDDGALATDELVRLLRDVLPAKRVVEDVTLKDLPLSSGRRSVTLNARELSQSTTQRRLILVAITDTGQTAG